MKIAFVTATFPPYPAGTGVVCYYQSMGLVNKGHQVTIFTLDYSFEGNIAFELNGLEVIRLNSLFKFGGGGFFPQLFFKLKKFDIIHLHYPFFGGAEFVWFTRLLFKKKYVFTYNMDPWNENILIRMYIKVYEKIFLKRITKNAEKIFVPNNLHLYSSKIQNYISKQKIVELPNGVDINYFKPRKKDHSLLKKFYIQNEIIILFVGHLIPLKGLPLLIEAISFLDKKNIKLLILGTGPEKHEYKKLIKLRNLGKRIFFEGNVSHAQRLNHYYNICDFLVLPSIHTESFGMVIIEAMASGKPVIVSSLPGPSNLVNHMVDGLIFKVNDLEDLKNKIEYMIKNKKRWKQMGESGRRKVIKKYSWGKIIDSLEREYHNVYRS